MSDTPSSDPQADHLRLARLAVLDAKVLVGQLVSGRIDDPTERLTAINLYLADALDALKRLHTERNRP